MAKTSRQITGSLGESIAAKYLESKGFTVLGRNYRKPWGEIDLITKIGKVIVFVEVKSVSRETSSYAGASRSDQYRPEENMHPWKIERLHRAIESYLSEHVEGDMDWRLDLVAVEIDVVRRIGKCTHLENVFL